MPGLYGSSGNVTVNSSNTTGLYAIANTGNIVTANITSVNTTSLYGLGGNVYVPTSAQQLLNLLSNNGTVIFQLDPAYANQRVEAFATGGGGSGNTIINLVGDVTGLGTTGNALYTTISNTAVTSGRYGAGNLIPSFVVNSQGRITAASNVALNLSSYTGNVAGNNFIVTTGIFYSNGTPFVSSSYGNSNVAAYMPGFLSTYQGNIGATRTGNITTGNIYANNGIFNGNITVGNLRVTGVTNYANVTSSVTTTLLANANVASTNTTTGTIISYGGVGIVGDVNIGGNLNANLGVVAVGGNITTNSNVISGQGVYAPQYFWANGEVFQTSVYSNANVTAYLAAGTDPTINAIYANVGTLYLGNISTNANIGAFQTYANATFATSTNLQTLSANVGAFETYANTQINSTNANVQTLNANVGAYQIWANANVSGISSNLGNLQLNVNNFENYANLTLTSHQTEITNIVTQGNANTAAYLSTYTGNIGLSGSASQVIVPITASGTWTVPAGVTNIQLLLVGGGGGGSGTTATINYSGAGGAGGNVLYLPSVTVTSGGTYSITIGDGGTGTSANGNSGGSTSAFGYTVLGGAGGLVPGGGTAGAGGTTAIPNNGGVGAAGGTGAGGGSSSSNNGQAGSINIAYSPAQLVGGDGGNGYYFTTLARAFGGGGGGGTGDQTGQYYNTYGVAGSGGSGGGGNGGGSNTAYTPANGTANTGGGGGGAAAGATYRTGANGGSGVVYIIYSGLNLTYPQNIVSNTFVIGQNIVWANGTSFAATIPGNYGNANVASYLTDTYLPAYQGNIGSTRTGNVNTGKLYSVDVNLSGNINSSLSGIGTALYINAGNIVIPATTFTYFNGNANLNGSYLITGTGTTGIGGTFPVTSWANISLVNSGSGIIPYFKGPLIGNVTATTITTGNITSTNGYFWANGLPYSGAYGNTQVAAYLASNTDPTINTINANIGAFETYANVTFSTVANAASQQTQINTNTTGLATLNANVGAFETYANVTFGTQANAASQQTQIDTLNANVGAFETYANVTFSTQANAASQQTQIDTKTTGLATLNANVGAFETYANSTFLTSSTSYGNANVAAYLPVFGGNILAGNVNIPYTSGTRNRGQLAIGGNVSQYDTGVIASFIGDEPTYLYTSLQNSNSGATAYSSYALNDDTHTYYGELGINSSTYNYTSAGYPDNAFSKPYATFLQSTGANLAIGTYGNYGINFVVNGGTVAADAMTIANNGNVTVAGNLTAGGTTTLANVKSTNGYFWANGTAYSSGSAFTGNLAGSVLYDSVNARTFSNAFPLSTPFTAAGGQFQNVYVNVPTYTNGQLQQPPLTANTPSGSLIVSQSGQVIGFAQTANVALQSGYSAGAQNRNTIGAQFTTFVNPVTANTMSGNDRVRGLIGALEIDPQGKTWGVLTTTSQNSTTLAAVNGIANFVNYGNVATLIGGAYGSFITPAAATTSNIQYSTSLIAFQTLQATAGATGKANVTYARMLSPSFTGFSANLTMQNAIGIHTYSGWAGTVGSASAGALNAYALLNEDATTSITTNGNIVLNGATSYLNATTGNVLLGGYRETVGTFAGSTGTITVNVGASTIKNYTLTGNITINTNNITNAPTGSSFTLILTQDATGGRTLTSNILFAGGSKTLSTAANAVDVLAVFTPDGTTFYGSLIKGYA